MEVKDVEKSARDRSDVKCRTAPLYKSKNKRHGQSNKTKKKRKIAEETSSKFLIFAPFSTPIRKTSRFPSVTETHIPCSR
ncbi:hypothetical protein L1887_05543 [Cichorium endivia]|nr:hypothetical protein L1887_05543 [Cichorium endivia]